MMCNCEAQLGLQIDNVTDSNTLSLNRQFSRPMNTGIHFLEDSFANQHWPDIDIEIFPHISDRAGSRELCLEAPSGVEPLHRSFAVRPMTRRPLTIKSDRVRHQKSEFKGFGVFIATDCD